MSVAISWANKMQLAKCDIMVGFPISSHILLLILLVACAWINCFVQQLLAVIIFGDKTYVDIGRGLPNSPTASLLLQLQIPWLTVATIIL